MSRRERTAERGVRAVLGLALRLLPRRRHVVVYGWGDDEGNALAVLRHLAEHYAGNVYWLVDSPPRAELLARLGPLAGRPPRLVRRRTPAALLHYLLAEGVFHTHGLFTSPHPGSRKTHVNLWHGDGPKRVAHSMTGSFSYLASGTRLFGEAKLRYFQAPANRLLVVGNPRVDEFDRPAGDDALRRLGLDPDRPLVLWMPTFRSATLAGQDLWTDAASVLGHHELGRGLDGALERARERGVQFVVKPHPLDAEAFDRLGVDVVQTGDVHRAGCTLYSLLARSTALVTDYSSVWTDYLVLDRPVLLFCPDLDEYEAGRAFTVDSLDEIAPGGVARTAEELGDFLVEVADGTDPSARRRATAAERIGAVVTTGATQRLFDELLRRGALGASRVRAAGRP